MVIDDRMIRIALALTDSVIMDRIVDGMQNPMTQFD